MTKEERDALERYDTYVFTKLANARYPFFLFITPLILKFSDWDIFSLGFLFWYYIALLYGGSALLLIRLSIHVLSITPLIEAYDMQHSQDDPKHPSQDIPFQEDFSQLDRNSLRRKIVAHAIKKGLEETNETIDVRMAQSVSKFLIDKYKTPASLREAKENMVRILDDAIKEELGCYDEVIKDGLEEKNEPVDESMVRIAHTASKALSKVFYPSSLREAKKNMVSIIDETIARELKKYESHLTPPSI